jgi:hypothetical protein
MGSAHPSSTGTGRRRNESWRTESRAAAPSPYRQTIRDEFQFAPGEECLPPSPAVPGLRGFLQPPLDQAPDTTWGCPDNEPDRHRAQAIDIATIRSTPSCRARGVPFQRSSGSFLCPWAVIRQKVHPAAIKIIGARQDQPWNPGTLAA